jgi:putative two-component system response regulator
LKGNDIPLEGRITAIADNFDALTTQRVYKPAYDFDHAKDLMLKERGTHFDPELLDIFFGSLDDVKRIYEQFADPTWLSIARYRSSTHDQEQHHGA